MSRLPRRLLPTVLIPALMLIALASASVFVMGQGPSPQPSQTFTPSRTITPLPTFTPSPTTLHWRPTPTFQHSPSAIPYYPQMTPTAPPASLSLIAIGQRVEGVLSAANPLVDYVFDGQAGQIISVRLMIQPPAPNLLLDFDGYLNPYYEPSYFDNLGNQIMTVVRVLPATRAYTIRLDGYYQASIDRPYTLEVREIVPQSIALDNMAEGSFADDQRAAAFDFQGEAGQLVAADIITQTPVRLTMLLRPEGSGAIALGTYESPYPYSQPFPVSEIVTQTGLIRLPENARYTLLVQQFTYDSYVQELPAGPFRARLDLIEPTPIAFGDMIDGALTDDQPTFYYQFEAEAGDIISAAVMAEGDFDTTLTLLSVERGEITFDDDGGPRYNPELNDVLINFSDTYILRVRGYGSADLGSFGITLTRAANSLDDGPITWRLTKSGSNNLLYFTAEAGATYEMRLHLVEGLSIPTTVISQNDQPVWQVEGVTLETVTTRFSTPLDGRAFVSLLAASFSSGTIEIRVERVAEAE
jgi:hypothetical protein